VDDELLPEVMRALDCAVVERLPNAMYFLVTPAPDWLVGVFDAAPAGAQGSLAGALPFLDHFLPQAEAVWYQGAPTRADSGPFTAPVGRQELLLRAAAFTVDRRPLLILERLTGEADTRPILQKAREQLLEHERLTRQAAAVHAPLAALGALVDDLASGTAVDPATIERLRSAVKTLQAATGGLPTPPPARRR
jgi:hypothetical protein